MAEAGFPPGVVNLVTGSGGEVGDAIVDSPDVSVISFTGSSVTGKHIAVHAGRRLKRVSLELGGKNGVVVLGDADLDLATDGILWSAFGTTGQRCTAASRVIVERSVVEPLLERLESRARKLRLGLRARPGGRRRSAHQRRRRRQGGVVRRHRARRGRPRPRWRPGDGRRPGRRPLLRADDLRRGRADGPDRPGGDLRTGPVGHPGRRLRGGDAGAQPDPLRPVVEHLHPRREHGVPGDARLRDRHRLHQRRARPAPRSTSRSVAGRRPATATARPGHVALDTYTEWKSIYVDFSGRLQRAQIDNQPG